MCLAVPAKVLEIQNSEAKVDYGGIKRTVNVSLVDISLGDYVLVHAGFAIQKIDEDEAKKSLELWKQISSI